MDIFHRGYIFVLFSLLHSTLSQCPPGCICLIPLVVVCPHQSISRIPVVYKNTTELELSHNIFSNSVISRSNFTGLLELKTLKMKSCGLTSIQSYAFTDLTKLDYLDLSLNNLKSLEPLSFFGLQLTYLFLNNNPQLILPSNGFLNFSTQLLDLSNCGLTDIQPSVFKPQLSSALSKILLQNNQIKQFDKAFLPLFSKLEVLRIQNNPLLCDCSSRWLKVFYDDRTIVFTDPSNGNQFEPRCGSPSNVAGEFFKNLNARDFLCNQPTMSTAVSFNSDRGVLSCAAKGDPTPTVSWYKPNGVISTYLPQANSATTTTTAELTVFSSDVDVHGVYTCVAFNEAGNASLAVNVTWPFNLTPLCISKDLSTAADVVVANKPRSSDESSPGLFKVKYFTLTDLIGAVLGTFAGTLTVCVLILHFCVYRRKKLGSQYSTPPLSDYSGNSLKNGSYPTQQRASLHNVPSQATMQNRPLPRIYDENHYMSTQIDENEDYLDYGQNSQRFVSPFNHPCQACRTISQLQQSNT